MTIHHAEYTQSGRMCHRQAKNKGYMFIILLEIEASRSDPICPIIKRRSWGCLACRNLICFISLESTNFTCVVQRAPSLHLILQPIAVLNYRVQKLRGTRTFLHRVARRAACAPTTIKRRREEMSPAGGSAVAAMSADRRVARMRELLRERGLTAYLVPSEDAHMSEYVAECDRRRHFLTGFTGSAGIALITLTGAYCWTDGRYFVQAAAELDSNVFSLMRMHEDPPVEEWAAANLKFGSVIGVDSSTVSIASMERLKSALKSAGSDRVFIKAMPPSDNLVDLVWGDMRPVPPRSNVFVHDVKYAGVSASNKLENVRSAMKERDAAVHIISGLDEVAWLFNLRASDVSYNPVFWSYAVITQDSATLYCDSSRFDVGVGDELVRNHVSVRPYTSILSDLETIPLKTGDLVWLDPNTCNYAIQLALSERGGVKFITRMGPVPLYKAAKNPVELAGMRACHIRDGVALARFLRWIEEEVGTNKRSITELRASDVLDGMRSRLLHYVSLSFPTISSAGANGAIIHYRPTLGSCATIKSDDMYLVDSGGQYRDGTTDVTRTIHMGQPTQWQRDCFTRVLKGHIAIHRAVFPKGTTGHILDAFARAPLWQGGLDYKHGTGHGVGSFLNVHEGPHVLSFKQQALGTALEPGFLTSNEPGYYEEGKFGIRIENICVVENCELDTDMARERPYYKMANLTWAPYQVKLMNPGLMTKGEIDWVDSYHQKCYELISPNFTEDKDMLQWLFKSTRSIDEQLAK